MRKNDIKILIMAKKPFLAAIPILLLILVRPVFANSAAVDYLCEIGISFYQAGRYEEALTEFKKALLLEPKNQTASRYISNIFEKEVLAPSFQEKARLICREQVVSKVLDNFARGITVASPEPQEKISEGKEKEAPAVSGEIQARFGATSQDAYWKQANWDLNEKNFRMLSNEALDNRQNSFDPRIYDRLRVNVDSENEDGLGFHGNITVDPWSFTGKSSKTTVSAGGDPVELELKYWSNTGYTINETINTPVKGDSFSLPEIKVTDGHTSGPVRIVSGLGTEYILPEMKIQREFQPIRELWFDYKQDDLKLRFFPIAYENQALGFDDPLKLSNNRIWWEDSPWIRGWKHGNFNSAGIPVAFTKGYWNNSLSFFSRDSEGQRLTSLRGVSFDFKPQEETSIIASVATPKHPWQNYETADNVLSAARVKQILAENLVLGVSATTRMGYNVDNSNKLDAKNYVGGLDLNYEITNGIKLSSEIAHSKSSYDLTNSDYKTRSRGFVYYLSLIGRFPLESILHSEYGYDGIKPDETEASFTKFRLFACRMDDSFDASLSSYVETRDDESWSRHLHFRQPFSHYYQGQGQTLAWDDIKPYRIGNGIDVGRNTLGLRIESLFWDKKAENLFDLRNVHNTEGKLVENVSREELTWDINDRLTSKVLGIYHHLPQTKGGTDPFVFDSRTRRYFTNIYIEDGKDPSVGTGSLGLEYKFFEWMALNGIWEYTNDISLGYDNFPRGILNSGDNSYIYYENGNAYRDVSPWLYSQQYFPKPPYPYYNIFKTGLKLNPTEKLELYLDYARNSYEKAGQVDDNMNHVGFELGYKPMPKLAMFFKYTYSRWQDLDNLNTGITKVYGHHNLFAEFIYRYSDDEDFTLQFGEASRDPYMGGVLDIGWDPYGGSSRTIDTQRMLRLYYRRKF